MRSKPGTQHRRAVKVFPGWCTISCALTISISPLAPISLSGHTRARLGTYARSCTLVGVTISVPMMLECWATSLPPCRAPDRGICAPWASSGTAWASLCAFTNAKRLPRATRGQSVGHGSILGPRRPLSPLHGPCPPLSAYPRADTRGIARRCPQTHS